MKSTTLKKILSILVIAVMVFSLAACNTDNGADASPEVSDTPTESPEVTETPEPTPEATPEPTPEEVEGQYFDRDLSFTADPESSFPGSIIFLGADGAFELDVPGLGNDKGTYSINGEKLDVKGSAHEFSFREENGEVVVILSAAGGALVVEFFEDGAEGGEGAEASAKHFDSDLSFTADPESSFPGSTIFLGADGTFELNVPGLGNDKGSYEIDGEDLKVTGSAHEFSFREEDGEIIVVLSAADGALIVDFLQD